MSFYSLYCEMRISWQSIYIRDIDPNNDNVCFSIMNQKRFPIFDNKFYIKYLSSLKITYINCPELVLENNCFNCQVKGKDMSKGGGGVMGRVEACDSEGRGFIEI